MENITQKTVKKLMNTNFSLSLRLRKMFPIATLECPVEFNQFIAFCTKFEMNSLLLFVKLLFLHVASFELSY